jgi:hypothetical protein
MATAPGARGRNGRYLGLMPLVMYLVDTKVYSEARKG